MPHSGIREILGIMGYNMSTILYCPPQYLSRSPRQNKIMFHIKRLSFQSHPSNIRGRSGCFCVKEN